MFLWDIYRRSTNLNRVLLEYNWDSENCVLYGVVGCPVFRGRLSIEANGRTVGTFRTVHYVCVRFSGVSIRTGSTVVQNIKGGAHKHSKGA